MFTVPTFCKVLMIFYQWSLHFVQLWNILQGLFVVPVLEMKFYLQLTHETTRNFLWSQVISFELWRKTSRFDCRKHQTFRDNSTEQINACVEKFLKFQQQAAQHKVSSSVFRSASAGSASSKQLRNWRKVEFYVKFPNVFNRAELFQSFRMLARK